MKFDDLRRLYDIRDLANMGRKKWAVCMLPTHVHKNNTPSFSVYWFDGVQKFKCHGHCGRYGDVIDFIGYMEIPGYDGELENRTLAAELLSGGRFKINPPPPPPPTPPLPQWLMQDIKPNREMVEYAKSRGITEAQIEDFGLGILPPSMRDDPYNIWDPSKWMAIPTSHKGELLMVKLRNMGEGIRYMAVPGSRKGLWGFDDVYLSQDPVLIMKGEICAIVARRFGFSSCAPTGGEGSDVRSIRTALSMSINVLVGDNDKQEDARRRGIALDAIVKFPPAQWNDWDSWALEDPKTVDETREWIEEARWANT